MIGPLRAASRTVRVAGVRPASTAAAATSGSHTHQSSTANGLRVASEASEGNLATIVLTVGAGSRCETHATNGSAHFLEHLSLKGTTNRANGALQNEMRSLGGRFSAFTTRDSTVFTATVLKKDVAQAVDILADVAQNGAITDAAVGAEKPELLCEIGTNPADADILDHLHDTAFLGTALGMPVMGTSESVKGLTAAGLAAFRSAHYTAPGMVLTATGAVDHAELAKAAESKFSGASNKRHHAPAAAPFTGSDVLYREDDHPTARVAWGFRTGGVHCQHYVPTMLMTNIIGSWCTSHLAGGHIASKLGQVAAEKHLVHSFGAFFTPYADTGLFGVQAVANDNKLFETSGWVLEHLVRLAHDVSEGELERAKASLSRELLARSNDRVCRAQDMGRQLQLLDHRTDVAEMVARVQATKLADIKAAAMDIVHDHDVAVAAVGPLHELPDYNWMRRRTYWLRY